MGLSGKKWTSLARAPAKPDIDRMMIMGVAIYVRTHGLFCPFPHFSAKAYMEESLLTLFFSVRL